MIKGYGIITFGMSTTNSKLPLCFPSKRLSKIGVNG